MDCNGAYGCAGAISQDEKQAALSLTRCLCAENGAKLLYLCVFGSALYGTSTASSDLDLRGLFVPSSQSPVQGGHNKFLHYSTGDNRSKNSSGDIDIDLWPVESWLLDLLPCGNIGALDLLFSPSNRNCAIFQDVVLDPVFARAEEFVDPANNRTYAQYAIAQAKKYGIKGSRAGALKSVCRWLDGHPDTGRLDAHLDSIAEACDDAAHCLILELPDGKGLALCGRIHPGGIKMAEFRKRVLRDMKKYGERLKAAEENRGIDFKALSHALRVLDQTEELLLTGRIVFPLAGRERLLEVKNGCVPWVQLEKIILARLAEIDRLCARLAGRYTFNRHLAEVFVRDCYGRQMSGALPA